MERQRIGKLGYRELWWRIGLSLGLSCFALLGWYASFSSGNMLACIGEVFFIGIGIISVLLSISIFSHLKDVLEHDEKCLYIVKIRYFRRLIDKCIDVKDITEILLFGRQKVLVTIKYGEKQAVIYCQKNDEVYKFLKELAEKLNILKQDEQTSEHSLIYTLLKLGIIGGIGWIYGKDILMHIFFIGTLAYIYWPVLISLVIFIILFKVSAKHKRYKTK